MPVVNIKKTENYVYALWQIEENLELLLKKLEATSEELIEINNITHLNRKKQNITARLLLNHLSMTKVKLSYSKHGAPYCPNFKHISISHSKNYCTLITSTQNVGIDIQYQKNNIKELQKKFINTIERSSLTNQHDTKALHLIWCAKEAIYKTLNNPLCSLKEDIYILTLGRKTRAYYKYGTSQCVQYEIEHDKFKNYFIAIATEIS